MWHDSLQWVMSHMSCHASIRITLLGLDSYVTWLIHVWHDSLQWVMSHIPQVMRNICCYDLIHMWRDSYRQPCHIWMSHVTYESSHSNIYYVWCVTWLTGVSHVTHEWVTSHMDQVIAAMTWFICDVTHSYVTWLTPVSQVTHVMSRIDTYNMLLRLDSYVRRNTEWVMSHTSCHTRHVTHVMSRTSHMNQVLATYITYHPGYSRSHTCVVILYVYKSWHVLYHMYDNDVYDHMCHVYESWHIS